MQIAAETQFKYQIYLCTRAMLIKNELHFLVTTQLCILQNGILT